MGDEDLITDAAAVAGGGAAYITKAFTDVANKADARSSAGTWAPDQTTRRRELRTPLARLRPRRAS
jgi:hypothetical protein